MSRVLFDEWNSFDVHGKQQLLTHAMSKHSWWKLHLMAPDTFTLIIRWSHNHFLQVRKCGGIELYLVLFWMPTFITRHKKFRAQTDHKSEVSPYYGNRDQGWYNKVASDGRFCLTHGLHISLDDKFLVIFVVGLQFLLQDINKLHRLYEEWDVLPHSIQPPLNLVKGKKCLFICKPSRLGMWRDSNGDLNSVNADRMIASTFRVIHMEQQRWVVYILWLVYIAGSGFRIPFPIRTTSQKATLN